jgi:hypothetical protein
VGWRLDVDGDLHKRTLVVHDLIRLRIQLLDIACHSG